MFMAYAAASLLTIGGYLAGRERKSLMKEFEKETREETMVNATTPLAHIAEQRFKPRENLRTVHVPPPAPVQPVEKNIMQMPTRAPVNAGGVAEARPVVGPTAAQEPAAPTTNAQPYRMDL